MAEEHKYSCRSVAEVKYGTVFLFNFGNIFAEAFEVELRGLLGKLFYFCILQVWRRKLRNVEHWLSISAIYTGNMSILRINIVFFGQNMAASQLPWIF